MRARFLHFADCHLGYRQYGSKDRFNDFSKAFVRIVKEAINQEVDFVILAGDLFEKRAIDALTLSHAMRGLEMLARADIPCIAVEGNHEIVYYTEAIGWMRFLAERELLVLLNPAFEDGKATLAPYTDREGAYFDPVPGLRVYGMRYFGSSTASAIQSVAEALSEQPRDDVEYTVFVAHTGVEGVLPGNMGGLRHNELAPLRPHVDYLALGHIHKPFTFDNWIYNAGSPETCSMEEVHWADRGFYLVEVDTDRPRADGASAHIATLHPCPRRPFERLYFKVDHCTSPQDLHERCASLVKRKAADLRRKHNGAQPVVELRLGGVLPFDRSALDVDRLKDDVAKHFDPLIVHVKNGTQPAEFAIDAEEQIGRRELERQIVGDLLQRDVRFQKHADDWTDLALAIKRMALTNTGPEAILDELTAQMEYLEGATTTAQADESAPDAVET